MRSRLGRVLLAVLTAVAVTPGVAPGVAAAEGPGYGGGADRLHVKWRGGKAETGSIVVYGVGFRSGSAVALRVGSGAEKTAYADQSGALRVDVTALEGAREGTQESGRLASGVSVFAVGTTPSGTALRLVGAVPPEPSGRGPLDYLGWLLAAAAGLAGVGGLALRRRRPAPAGGPTVAATPAPAKRADPSAPAERAAPSARAKRAALVPAKRPARRRGHGSKR